MISSKPNKTSIEIKKKRLLFTQTMRLKAILQPTQPHDSEVSGRRISTPVWIPLFPLQVSPAYPCTKLDRGYVTSQSSLSLLRASCLKNYLFVYYPDDSAALGSAVDAQ